MVNTHVLLYFKNKKLNIKSFTQNYHNLYFFHINIIKNLKYSLNLYYLILTLERIMTIISPIHALFLDFKLLLNMDGWQMSVSIIQNLI